MSSGKTNAVRAGGGGKLELVDYGELTTSSSRPNASVNLSTPCDYVVVNSMYLVARGGNYTYSGATGETTVELSDNGEVFSMSRIYAFGNLTCDYAGLVMI